MLEAARELRADALEFHPGVVASAPAPIGATASGGDDAATASGRDDATTASGRDDAATATNGDDDASASGGDDAVTVSGDDGDDAVTTTTRAAAPFLASGASIFAACRRGRVDQVQLCLDRGDAVDKADKHDHTPLLIACDRGHVDVARLLLDRGARHERRSKQGWTPLLIACANGHLGTARLLIDRGADAHGVKRKDGLTPLLVASSSGKVQLMRLCLDCGANVNRADQTGRTPLFHACEIGQIDAARLCLERGAKADRQIKGKLSRRGRKNPGPYDAARANGHHYLAAWLRRVRDEGGWRRFLSEPRYSLTTLRALVANGRAERVASAIEAWEPDYEMVGLRKPRSAGRARRAAPINEAVLLDFLFSVAPDRPFRLICRYFWAGQPEQRHHRLGQIKRNPDAGLFTMDGRRLY